MTDRLRLQSECGKEQLQRLATHSPACEESALRFHKRLGPKGWVGVRLDRRIDWKGITQLITDSYRMIAPKRLANSV